MATLDTDEANLIDAQEINWRLIIYPLVAAIVVVLGGLAIYYYKIAAQEQLEATARTALLAAKTPEDLVKVADQYPNTAQAALALLDAGGQYYKKNDFANATTTFQKVAALPSPDDTLAASARLGVAAAEEAAGKVDDAIAAYVREGDIGIKNPYAAYAYFAAAQLYEQKGDKQNERRVLSEAAGLDPDSQFVKQAQMKLKELAAAEQPAIVPPSGAPSSAQAAPASPGGPVPSVPTPNGPPPIPPTTH